jgi:hypothetical protein
VLHALRIDRAKCRAWAERFSWQAATEQFIAQQVPVPSAVAAARSSDTALSAR